MAKVGEVIRFWEATKTNDSEEFKAVQHLPSWRLVRDQTLAVLGALVPPKKDANPPTGPNNPTALAAVLEAAPAHAYCSSVGSEILKIMGCDNLQEAILASLLTPHRQMYLPTCSLDSLVNSETFNHPERLAKVYSDLLTTEANKPVNVGTRDMTVASQEIQHSSGSKEPTLSEADSRYVLVTPNQSDINRKYIFGLMTVAKQDGTTTVVASARDALAVEGIGIECGDTYRLRYPIRDMTDLFFADLMQNIYEKCDADEAYINVRSDYFGVGDDVFLEREKGKAAFTSNDGLFPLTDLAELKAQAKALCEMRSHPQVATIYTQRCYGVADTNAGQGAPDAQGLLSKTDPFHAHIENLEIDLERLRDINPGAVDGDFYYIIGDRNYLSNKSEARYLALKKTGQKDKDGQALFTFAKVEYEANGHLKEVEELRIKWIAFEKESGTESL